MEEMIQRARLDGHDLTPDIGMYNRWESTFISSDYAGCGLEWINTFSAGTPETAVKMAYNALYGLPEGTRIDIDTNELE